MVKNGLLGPEIQSSKKIGKSSLEPHFICFRRETARNNNLYSKNYKTLKNGKDLDLLYSLAKAVITRKRGQKWTVLRSNLKLQKHDSRTTLELFYGKKALKNHLMLEEWQDFEKWQKSLFSCKAYRNKNVKYGLFRDCTSKLQKRFQKRLANRIIVVPCYTF